MTRFINGRSPFTDYLQPAKRAIHSIRLYPETIYYPNILGTMLIENQGIFFSSFFFGSACAGLSFSEKKNPLAITSLV